MSHKLFTYFVIGDKQSFAGKDTIRVAKQLTDKERIEFGHEAASLDSDLESLRQEADLVKKGYKTRIDAKELERQGLSKVIISGENFHTIKCSKFADYGNNEMIWVDKETREIVNVRAMCKEEQ